MRGYLAHCYHLMFFVHQRRYTFVVVTPAAGHLTRLPTTIGNTGRKAQSSTGLGARSATCAHLHSARNFALQPLSIMVGFICPAMLMLQMISMPAQTVSDSLPACMHHALARPAAVWGLQSRARSLSYGNNVYMLAILFHSARRFWQEGVFIA